MIWTDPGLVESDMLCLGHEDIKQLKKWGTQQHTPAIWMLILSEEVGELAKTILEHENSWPQSKDIKEEAIQVATLALKIAKMSQEAQDDR